jgi:hypothetical protein
MTTKAKTKQEKITKADEAYRKTDLIKFNSQSKFT